MDATPVQCIGLPVETESGTPLGAVINVEIDPDTNLVQNYLVSSSSIVKRIFSQQTHHIISPQQVVSLTPEKMVVKDLLAGETVDVGEVMEQPVGATQPSAVAESRQE